jgi:hypothetical protein
MTGKAIVPIRMMSRGRYVAEFQGEHEELDESELGYFKDRVTFNGFYPWVAEESQIEQAEEDEDFQGRLFEEFMVDQARRWTTLAADRLDDSLRCFISPGNDDFLIIDDVLREAERIEFPDRRLQRDALANTEGDGRDPTTEGNRGSRRANHRRAGNDVQLPRAAARFWSRHGERPRSKLSSGGRARHDRPDGGRQYRRTDCDRALRAGCQCPRSHPRRKGSPSYWSVAMF